MRYIDIYYDDTFQRPYNTEWHCNVRNSWPKKAEEGVKMDYGNKGRARSKEKTKEKTIEDKSDDDGEQGWIHGRTVADGWTGAVMRKPLAIQNFLGPMDRPTNAATLSVSAIKKDEMKEKNNDKEGE